MKIISIFIFVMIQLSLVYGQESELFTGESKLVSCKVNLPLTHAKKDKEECEKMASIYKDVRLVLLDFDKKTKKVTYNYYYVVVKNINGNTFVYLLTPKSYDEHIEEALFVPFNISYDRFYKADCFDIVLESNNQLKELWQLK